MLKNSPSLLFFFVVDRFLRTSTSVALANAAVLFSSTRSPCWLVHPCMHGAAMQPLEFGCLCQHLDVLSVSQRWRSCGSFQLSEGCCFHGTCHHSHGVVLDSGVLFSSCFGGCRCCCHSISQDWSDSSNIEFLEYFLVCAQLCSRKLLHQCQQ